MTATLLIGSAAAKPHIFQRAKEPPKADFKPELAKPKSGPPPERLHRAAAEHKTNQAEANVTEPNAHEKALDFLEKELSPEGAEAVWAWLNGQPQPQALPVDMTRLQAILTELGIQVPAAGAAFTGETVTVSFGKPGSGNALGNFTQITLPGEGAEPTLPPDMKISPGFLVAPPPPGEHNKITHSVGEIEVTDTPASTPVDAVGDAPVSNEAIKNFLLSGLKGAETSSDAETDLTDSDADAEAAPGLGEISMEPKPHRSGEGHSIFQTRLSDSVKEAPKPLNIEHTQAVRQQAIDQILEMAAERPGRAVTIRLNPEELGTITVQLLHREEGHEVQVKASHESVRAALGQSKHELTQQLEAKGVNLLSFDVGSDAANADNSAKQQMLNREDFSASRRIFGGGSDTKPQAAPRQGSPLFAGVNYLA